VLAVLVGGAGAVLAGITVGLNQYIIAGFLVLLGTILAFLKADVAVIFALVYVALQGDIRRLAGQQGGYTTNDPLVLVSPAIVIMLLIKMLVDGAVTIDTRLAKLIFALLLIMGLQVFNPIQGGITVGLAGILFYAVPLFWYWVGKSMSTPQLTRLVFNVLIFIALGAALLGLYQTFKGFLPYEARWIRYKIQEQHYTALTVGTEVRPFGFSCSSTEYAFALLMGSVALMATFLTFRIRRIGLFIVPMLLALFLASAREPIVGLVLAVAVMWGAMGRTSVGSVFRFATVPILAVPLILSGLLHLHNLDMSDRVQVLTQHQVDGFEHPGDSSAPGHLQSMWWGVTASLKNPLGKGLGATSMAAGRAAKTTVDGTEVDLSDMLICLGIGGYVYIAVVAFGIVRAITHFRAVRTVTALAVLGVMVATGGAWIQGSMYSIGPFVCFLLGCVDQQQLKFELAAERSRSRGGPVRRPSASSRRLPAMAPAVGSSMYLR
jgi:hypothetical protein